MYVGKRVFFFSSQLCTLDTYRVYGFKNHEKSEQKKEYKNYNTKNLERVGKLFMRMRKKNIKPVNQTCTIRYHLRTIYSSLLSRAKQLGSAASEGPAN